MDAIMQVPKKPMKQLVDTRTGDKQLLEPSGLEPVYIHKKVLLLLLKAITKFFWLKLVCICNKVLL